MDGEHIKVLLVEDNSGDARLIQEMLAEVKSVQFELERADRVSSGIERILKGGVNVIILDLSLPDSDGLDTFISIYAQATEVPIVVLTGINDESLAMKAVQDGAQDYLVKGQVDSNLLVRSIRYAIERKKAELVLKGLRAKLAAANKMAAIGTLTGGVAHKINNPLSVIILNIQMIREMLKKGSPSIGAEELSKLVKRIETSSMHAKKIVSDLLLFTRGNKFELKPLSIEKVMKNTLSSIEGLGPVKIKIKKKFASDLPQVLGNSDRLVHAFSNIVQNAVEAMPKGGTLKIEAGKRSDEEGTKFVEINFIDEGCGIAGDRLDKLFDPFFSTKDMGTGLGLCISRGVIESYNGTINVESQSARQKSGSGWSEPEEADTGTTVTVRLKAIR